MTSEPLLPECAELQRRLAEGDAGPEVLDHLVGCEACSGFAAAVVELEARLARLPQPEPPAGAADRAIARFRAEVASHGALGEAPHAPAPVTPQLTPAGPPLTPAGPPLTPPLSPSAGTAPPSQAPPGRPPRAGHARSRRWRPRVIVAAGVAAAIALVVALVSVLGPGSTPPAYAAILDEAAVHTAATKSFQFDLSGSIGFTIRGQNVPAVVTGIGATVLPDKAQLSQVDTLDGKPLLQQDVVTVGNRAWTRSNGGQWVQVAIPPDHASPVDQALDNPAEALNDLTRVGSDYRSLATTTISGTRVRQIQLTIPGGSFRPFGNLAQRASRWTVVVGVSQDSLILRRITITGRGVVNLLGTQVPYTYSLQLTLLHFGAKVSIEPPVVGPSPAPSASTSTSAGSPPTATPSGSPGPSAAARPTPSLSSSKSSPRPSATPTPCPRTSTAATKPSAPAARSNVPCANNQHVS